MESTYVALIVDFKQLTTDSFLFLQTDCKSHEEN